MAARSKGLVSVGALADVEHREAARLLALLVDKADLKHQDRRQAVVEIAMPLAVFDRLCLWGAARENDEDGDPRNADGEAEPEMEG
jgi:hypothetical protein